jgi:GntR family transcriptional regulator
MDTKYGRIASDLRDAIAEGRYAPGDKLPTHSELTSTYGVARGTARMAILALINEGLATALGPYGIVVRDTSSLDMNSSLETPHPMWSTTTGPAGATETVTAETSPADAEIAERLRIDVGTEVVYRVKHYRKGRDVALIHEQWIPIDIAQTIAQACNYNIADPVADTNANLYDLMRTSGQIPDQTTETVRARMPDPAERETMNMPAGSPVLITKRITRDATGRPLETSDFTACADRASQTYTMPMP